jgi:hypothetical protein
MASSRNKLEIPTHLLWDVFFTDNKNRKNFKCKLCGHRFDYDRYRSSTKAKNHLNTEKHYDEVRARLNVLFGGTAWNNSR